MTTVCHRLWIQTGVSARGQQQTTLEARLLHLRPGSGPGRRGSVQPAASVSCVFPCRIGGPQIKKTKGSKRPGGDVAKSRSAIRPRQITVTVSTYERSCQAVFGPSPEEMANRYCRGVRLSRLSGPRQSSRQSSGAQGPALRCWPSRKMDTKI